VITVGAARIEKGQERIVAIESVHLRN